MGNGSGGVGGEEKMAVGTVEGAVVGEEDAVIEVADDLGDG